jgi:hypothetical protein
MSSILKKLLAFAMLLIAAGHLKAQVPGRVPVKKIHPVVNRPMTSHSYNWYRTDLQKRYPHLDVPVTKRAPLSAAPRARGAIHSQPTYAQTRQDLLRRYPQLQQQVTMAAPGRTLSTRTLSTPTSVLPAGRSIDYYRQLVQIQVEKARIQAEQARMHSQPVQPANPNKVADFNRYSACQ